MPPPPFPPAHDSATATPAAKRALADRIRPLLRLHRGKLILALVLNAICGAATAFQTMAPKWLIDDILLPPELSTADRWHRFIIFGSVFLVTALLLRMLTWHLGYRLFTFVREQAVMRLRAAFFDHLNHLCLRFHVDHPSGELFSYLFGSPLQAITGFYQHVTSMGPQAVIMIGTILVVAGSWDPLLTTALLLCSLTNVALMHRSRKRMGALHREYQALESEVSGVVGDLLRGTRAVKLHAMEAQVAADFSEQVDVIRQKSYRRDVLGHVEYMKQEGWGYITFTLVMGLVLWRYSNGLITIGEVSGFFSAYFMLQMPLGFAFQAFVQWSAAAAGLARIGTVLATASTTPDPAPADELPVPATGDLAFHGVTFAYRPGTPVLHRLDLTIPYGQRIAVVGPSGAGKSTLSQLLLRLYDPDQGTVTLAGIDLRRLRGAALRSRIGVVPQDPHIFRTTIEENVVVAKPEADPAQIRLALERANAWEFVAAMPDLMATKVGEGGATLSGGQRQRLAIARALLADTPFFIFDEATSALDTLSEELIQRTLDTGMAGRTCLIIAHRLATVRSCERIIVLDQGRVVQDGTFTALMDQPGLFRDLVQSQQLRQ